MTKIRVLVGAVALLATVAFSASPADATHAWGNYHWARTANPFTLQLGDNLDSTWDAKLDLAITDWSQSSVLDLTKVTGSTRPKTCKPTAGRVEVCNARYGYNGWLGLAQIWLSNGHISQGAAKMNDSYLASSSYTNTNRQHVLCQEVGHTFGLTHQDESGADLNTCMDYSNALDNPHPNAHDYEELGTIYSHLDSFNSYTTSLPSGTAGTKATAPSDWGRAIGFDQSGRANVFAKDLGGGNLVITHVTWVG